MTGFTPGQAVRVVAADPLGHVRTPRYVRGKAGVVEAVVGECENPEELAYGRRGRNGRVYRVRFALFDLFGEPSAAADTVHVELFEHWLERR